MLDYTKIRDNVRANQTLIDYVQFLLSTNATTLNQLSASSRGRLNSDVSSIWIDDRAIHKQTAWARQIEDAGGHVLIGSRPASGIAELFIDLRLLILPGRTRCLGRQSASRRPALSNETYHFTWK